MESSRRRRIRRPPTHPARIAQTVLILSTVTGLNGHPRQSTPSPGRRPTRRKRTPGNIPIRRSAVTPCEKRILGAMFSRCVNDHQVDIIPNAAGADQTNRLHHLWADPNQDILRADLCIPSWQTPPSSFSEKYMSRKHHNKRYIFIINGYFLSCMGS